MKIQELGIEEMARLGGATHRVIVTYDDLNGTGTGYGALSAASAASTTGTLAPFGSLEAAGISTQFYKGRIVTNFAGTSITELTLQIGYDLSSGTDKPAGLLPATSVCGAATPVPYFPAEIADFAGSSWSAGNTTALNSMLAQSMKVFSVTKTVGLLFTATGANLSAMTAGEVHLYFGRVDFSKL